MRPCLGVMCERHWACARYAAIDGASMPSETFLPYCAEGTRPLFVAIPDSSGSTDSKPDSSPAVAIALSPCH